jgi:glycosyltransferase EpsF
MKIKVLQVVGTMNRGGAEVMLIDLFRQISSDFQFDFLVNYKLSSGIPKGDFDEEILLTDSKIHYIPAQWDLGVKKYIVAFQELITEIGVPDIVHIHMNSKCGVIAKAAKLAGIKHVIAHSHADLKFRGRIKSRIASNLELQFQKRLIAKYADNFWGCSPEANRSLFYNRLLIPSKSAVINNAIDVDAYVSIPTIEIETMRKSWGVSSNTIVFGNVGRIVAHKNIDFLLDVFNVYQTVYSDFIFVIAGRIEDQTYYDAFTLKAKTYGLKDKIKYIGVRSDVPLVFRSFDVFLGPALKEGFGMVAVEAQAAGLPSVLYTGFPKSVDMELGLVTFISNFEVNNWLEAIKNINFKRVDLKEVKKKIISKGFDIQTNVETIETMYRKIVNE